jgi:protein-S-isoprenylcysteine O-methyltransferase Ste14
MQMLALVLYGVGLFLRYVGSRVLGRYFTRHVTVEAEMTFISNGPYRYLRHPLYLGLFLIIIAFPIYIGNVLGLIVFGPLIFIALNYRMVLEEKALEHHHPEYRIWKKKRYRFLPFIY